jgi:3-hydroxybutyryl-CoA dehydrogenase
MPFDPSKPDLLVGVVGTGAMGRGIVQVSAQGGMRVVCFDEKAGAAEAAKAAIAKVLAGLAERGRVPQADADAAIARITLASSLEQVARADVVVEAIVEKLDVKQSLFAALDRMAGPDTIIASNTSSLPVTAIAATCQRPERCAGLHFFNPVPLMKLVEVIPGLKTAPWVTDALMLVGRRMTRDPVLCTDSPGFIVNHIGRGYVPEAARIVQEGIAAFHEVDRIMTGAPGFRMGPFTLLDLVGADVSVSVMESFFHQYYAEPMYAPSSILRQRVDAGLFGQKTGAGWYTYTDGRKVEPPSASAPARSSRPVWVRPGDAVKDFSDALAAHLAKSGVTVETGSAPGKEAVILVTPVGWTVTEAAVDLKLDPARTVGVDMLLGLKGPRTAMITPATDPAVREAAHAALAADGQPVIVVNDSPGFVAQRIVAHVVNVACQIAQRGIATPADIDKGAKLGLAYPYGPLEWGDQIGPKRICWILDRLAHYYGEPRYRPSPWLKRRASLGLSLLAPDRRES